MAITSSLDSITALIILLIVVLVTMGYSSEILVDDENSQIKLNTVHMVNEEDYMEEGSTCHIEYQVMKRVIGTCIKLGKGARGCVAGNYLHPLHPECMM